MNSMNSLNSTLNSTISGGTLMEPSFEEECTNVLEIARVKSYDELVEEKQ